MRRVPVRPTRAVYMRRRIGVLAGFATVICLAYILFTSGGHKGSENAAADSRAKPTTTTTLADTPVNASMFATGACEEFRPTSGDNHTVVFLDAGHGGMDPGAVGTTESGVTIHEADETLPVELDALAMLRAAGYTVVVSRTGDSSVVKLSAADVDGTELSLQGAHDDVAARDECANLAHAQLLVGIYFDSGASPTNAGAVTGYDTDRSFTASNLRFAGMLQDHVLADLNAEGLAIPDEGVLPDSGLGSSVATSSGSALAESASTYHHLLLLGPADPGYFPTPSQMPGAVIEPLYITDPFEGSVAASTSGQHTIAAGIAQAVEQYFAPPPATSSTSAAAARS